MLEKQKRKLGTYKFVNDNLCENLIGLVDKLNNRTYMPQPSNCYVITEPALREIYAAQFGDGIIQHFYMKEVEEILEKELVNSIPLLVKKLEETHQTMNKKKTKIDTAYHGVPFLGKVSYPYGYQKSSKQVIIRVCQKAKNIKYISQDNLLSKTNTKIGSLKNYNCKKLILHYAKLLPKEVRENLQFDDFEYKFKKVVIQKN